MAHASRAPAHGGNRSYIRVGIALGVLTAIALVLAYAGVLPVPVLVPVLVVLAFIQVYLQADVFMHLRQGRRLYTIFFVAGFGVALTVFLGTLVLMWQH